MGSLSQELKGNKVYLDVNVFIYALEDMAPWAAISRELFTSLEAGEWQAVTSKLSVAECLVKPFSLGRADLAQIYREALSPGAHLTVAALHEEILVSAARLRAQLNFKLPDALHAATALNQGCTIMLTNDAGFRKTPGVRCVLLSDWIAA